MTTKIDSANGHNLLLVEVPERSIRFNIDNGILYWTTPLFEKSAQVENDKWEILPIENDYELIGTIENSVLDFNPEPYVEKHRDYVRKNWQPWTKPNKTFLSLLAANNIQTSNRKWVCLKIK